MKKGTAKSLISLTILSLILSLAYLQTIAFSVSEEESPIASSVTIAGSLAITLSGNYTTEGVVFKTAAFGNPASPSTNNNATGNNNNSLTGGCGIAGCNMTQYWLTVDSTTNVPVMTCLKDNVALGLTDGSANITNTNYLYKVGAANTGAALPYPSTVAITTSYVNTSSRDSNAWMNATNTTLFYRYTLNVPAGQKAGTYSNNLLIKAAELDVTAC